MKLCNLGLVVLASAFLTVPAAAQTPNLPIPPASSAPLPPGISFKKTPLGDVYVDAQGRVLYGMDTRLLRLQTRSANTFCSGSCVETWKPVAAPAGMAALPPTPNFGFGGAGAGLIVQAALGGQAAQAALGGQAAQAGQNIQAAIQGGGGGGGGLGRFAYTGPDWAMVQGINGPQLMYKGWNLVFVRNGDAPGSTKWDGEAANVPNEPAIRLWNALRYVPPVPKLVAPPNVAPLFIGGAYAMTDTRDHVLYVRDKPQKCNGACENPVPFRAGLVSQGIGDWTVSRAGEVAQWLYRGKPVFVSQGAPKSADVPAGATILRPDSTSH